jgi:PAS domain S-box-containing protein
MLRSAALAAAFAILYFLTAKLTGWLTGDPAVFWPASGVYLGVMLVAPRHLWSPLACAAGVGSLVTYLHGGASLELSVAFAVPSSAEGLLAALLVERMAGKRFTLAGVRDLLALVVGGAIVANGLVALSAAAIAAQSFDASFAESWLRWWSADALGMIAVVPIFTAERRGLRTAALGCLGVGLVAAHVATEAYAVQGFLAVLLLGLLAFAAAAHDRERLRDDLGRSKEELERRRAAQDHASQELEGSAERLERADRRIAQLTAELAARSAEVHDATRGRERLAADLRDMQAARQRTERELADARHELSRASAERGSLEDELSRVSDENGALEDELSRVSRQNDALEGALSRVSAQHGALREELSRAGAQNGALEEELAAALTEHRALQHEFDSVRSEHVRIGEALAEAASDRRRVEQELDQTERALEKARALLLEERTRFEQSLDEITATLAHTEAERRLLADHATELIARYDERGTCLYASPAARRLLGFEPEELVGHAGAELLHPEDSHLLSRARAMRSESTFQARLRHKTGDYLWVEVCLRPVLAHDGDRPVAITTTIREISRHRNFAAA